MNFFEELLGDDQDLLKRYATFDKAVEEYGDFCLADANITSDERGRLDAWGMAAPYIGELAIADEDGLTLFWRGEWPHPDRKIPIVIARLAAVEPPPALSEGIWTYDVIKLDKLKDRGSEAVIGESFKNAKPLNLHEALFELAQKFPPNYALKDYFQQADQASNIVNFY